MKRIANILIMIGFLTSINASCERVSTSAVTPENSTNWQTAWLDQPICKPPCWQGITPGVTTRDDAVLILENTPGVIITYNKKSGLDWNFGTKAEGGTMSFSEEGIVSVSWLSSINKDLPLEKVVAVYSFPDYVKPHDCREEMCDTVLIYPDLGMFINVFLEIKGATANNTPILEVLPDTIITRVYFIEPGMGNFQKIADFQDYDILLTWKGYGEYP